MTDEHLFFSVFQNIVISSAAERVSPRFLLKSEQFEDLIKHIKTVVLNMVAILWVF